MSSRNSTVVERIGELLRDYGLLGLRLGERFARRHGMEHVDLRALVVIGRAERAGPPYTARDLRAELALSAGGTTLVLDRLERAGLIERVRDPHDRRAVRLHTAPGGVQTRARHFGALAPRLAQVAQDFTEAELETVARFLTAVVHTTGAHLAELADERPP